MITPVVADMNHNNSVNFSQLPPTLWGIIHKARQGLGFGDPKYAQRMAAVKSMGKLWAAYDFATGDDPVANANEFLAYSKLGPKDGAWLDFEDNTASEMTADEAYTFLDTVNQKRGIACGIYGGNRIREQINAQDPRWIDLAEYTPLWQCRYIASQPNSTTDLFAAIPPIAPWKSNMLIQYTGDGIGPMPHTVGGLENGADLNAFIGLFADLCRAWPGGTLPAAPAVAQAPTPQAA
jgi:lysozyme